ncbi:hypothetical protein SGP15020_42590 [Shigella flexneri]|nr:hypothetical protein SGP15020_42590 [Shigella flexneri]
MVNEKGWLRAEWDVRCDVSVVVVHMAEGYGLRFGVVKVRAATEIYTDAVVGSVRLV